MYSLEWPKLTKPYNTKCKRNVERLELSDIAGGNTKWFNSLGKQFNTFLLSSMYTYSMS